jgi:hypothetical protein
MQLGSGPHCGGSSCGNLIVRDQRLSAASHVANIAGASHRFLFWTTTIGACAAQNTYNQWYIGILGVMVYTTQCS